MPFSENAPGLFLFDIDGTLLHAGTEVHREAFDHVYRAVYGLHLTLNGVSAAGRTDRWLLAEPLRRAGIDDDRIWEKMSDAFHFMEEYVEECLGDLHSCILPGVPEVLEGLRARGQLLGLLTGNLSRIAMAKMRQAGLASYFDTGAFGEESEVRADLVPVALHKVRTKTGAAIHAKDSILIGDTPLDVEAGRYGGTLTAGVATGSFSTRELHMAGADLVMASLADADGALEQLLRLRVN